MPGASLDRSVSLKKVHSGAVGWIQKRAKAHL